MRRLLTMLLMGAAASTAAPAAVVAQERLPDPLANPKAFLEPPMSVRPKFRWWWATPYDEKVFVEEVNAIADAGFGGVEIAYNEDGWATPEQRKMLEATLGAAKRRGMEVDMTMGAAWPVRTPNTAPETGLAEQELVYGRQNIAGPSVYAGPAPRPPDDPGNQKGAKLVAVTAARVVEPGPPAVHQANAPFVCGPAPGFRSTVVDPESLVDLSDKVDASGNVRWDVPQGEWIVFGFWQRPAEEAVMDHLSADSARAVTSYLDQNQIGATAAGLLRGTGGSFFEDSLELDVVGLFWTPKFLEEFRRRRGYDAKKYLPLMYGQCMNRYWVPDKLPPPDFDLPGGAGSRYAHDYYETTTDLYIDRHIAVFSEWAKKYGMRWRAQVAFGNSFDLIRSARETVRNGGLADDESLNAGDTAPFDETHQDWRFALDHYRTTASGAHQGGETEISSELGAVFVRELMTNLADYKAIMDKQWSAGLTRPIVHGYQYQSPGARWPGANRFAGVVAESWNRRTFPQWSMWKPLADYWARGTLILQRGTPRTDVAIYRDGFVTTAATAINIATSAENFQVAPTLPQAVYASPAGGQRQEAVDPGPTAFFDAAGLEQAGYSLQYIDPVGVRDPQARGDGVLFPRGPAYRALVVDQRAMPAATAEAIARAAERGLAVVFVGAPPDRGTSGDSPRAEDARVKSAIERTLGGRRVRRVARQAQVREALAELGVDPAASFSKPSPVYTQRRSAGDDTFYYLWNSSRKAVELTSSFRATGAPSKLDLWTGEVEPVAVFREREGRVDVPIKLAPGETLVLGFNGRIDTRANAEAADADEAVVRGTRLELRDGRGGRGTVRFSDGSRREVDLPKPPAPVVPAAWKLRVDEFTPDGITPHDLELDALRDWREIEGITEASGTGTYTTQVTLAADWVAPQRGTWLELGRVEGAIQLFVNGRRATPDSVARHRYDISELLRAGANELRVVLTTTLKNKVAAETRRGRISGGPTHSIQQSSQPYGLFGPVRFVPFARASIVRPLLPRSARRCTSRRRFAIHVRARGALRRARRATLRIGDRSRRVAVRRVGRRLRVVLDLRGRAAGPVRVRLTVRSGRRVVRTTRNYRLCARKRR